MHGPLGLPVSQFFLLVIVCAQSSAVGRDPSCAEPRVQLETAIAHVSSLELQLEEAKQHVIATELQVRWCTLGANTTAPQRHSEAIFGPNGQGNSSDAGKSAHELHVRTAHARSASSLAQWQGRSALTTLYDGTMHMATTSLSVAPASLQRFLFMRFLCRR
jgi:hypothetical protein